MSVLYLLCGIPASGKSVFSTKQKELNSELVYVSRDAIRFSMVAECDAYFSRENEVFDEYVRQIRAGLSTGHNVIADATHITEKSRNKLLDRLDLTNVEVCPVVFRTDLDTCLKRNALRTGRAMVPGHVLETMSRDFTVPTHNEKHTYAHIFVANEDGTFSE